VSLARGLIPGQNCSFPTTLANLDRELRAEMEVGFSD
jgi:hypothetical protein